MRVLFVGSGAVNLCLAGWMHSGISKATFLVRSNDNEIIRKKTFQCLLPGEVNNRVYACDATAEWTSLEVPDLVVIGVKNYSLPEVLDGLEKTFGSDIPVMSVLNGVEHIELISQKFSRSIFCTIAFNAFRTSPSSAVAVGNSVGLSSITDKEMMEAVHKILKRKISVSIVSNSKDAAHCKLVINLGNALLTMVGFHENRNRELPVLQHLTAIILNEGIDVVKKAGVKEAHISEMPNWLLIRLSKILPKFIVIPIFKKKMQTSSINSMAQDVRDGASSTEIDDINGYLVGLADSVGEPAPFNKALYVLFKEWVVSGAQPMRPSALLDRINSFSSR